MNIIITESPRDAMQGLSGYIPAQSKADYINSLLKVGFDIVDVGSFVSEKAIPQMKDTAEVLKKLELSGSHSEIMVLIANQKGAETAVAFDEVSWLAYPHSVSPTFLQLNINSDEASSIHFIDRTLSLCEKNKKKLKVYLTMAFGNPYQDEYNIDIVMEAVKKLSSLGIKYISLSDITGVSNTELINTTYSMLFNEFSSIEFGLHLHSASESALEKVSAAYKSGCYSFDAVINAMGGCPMTGYELVSNLNTLTLVDFLNKNELSHSLDINALNEAIRKNKELFR
jgi:hydroxymethylglutaryl-CoA lyase